MKDKYGRLVVGLAVISSAAILVGGRVSNANQASTDQNQQVDGDEHETADPGVPYDETAETPVLDDRESPCAPIMEAETPAINELQAAGLSTDSVPEFLTDEYAMGGVYCLADNVEQVVEGVYVEFWHGDTLVARWLTPGTPTAGDETWDEYMASLPGGGDVETLDDGMIALLPSAQESAIRSEIAQVEAASDYTNLWNEVTAKFEES